MKAKFIEVDAGVRYWEDAMVNGVEDDDGSRIPFRVGDRWCPVIELETGRVVNWPAGMVADIHYKVCDDGDYWLRDDERREVGKWTGDYVPDAFLCHGARGFGDYIIFTVGADGIVAGWERPNVDPAEWGG